jgi:hypothetical protein
VTQQPAYDAPRQPVAPGASALSRPDPSNLADVLERVLDKGVVVAGDIRIELVGIELLTIRLRLLVASVDRAREMGIDWWQHDPMLSSRAAADGDERRSRLTRGQMPSDNGAGPRAEEPQVEEPAAEDRTGGGDE